MCLPESIHNHIANWQNCCRITGKPTGKRNKSKGSKSLAAFRVMDSKKMVFPEIITTLKRLRRFYSEDGTSVPAEISKKATGYS
jgi:hypothetical protein